MDFGLTLIRQADGGTREALPKDGILAYLEGASGEITWDGEHSAYCSMQDGGVVNLRAGELYNDEPLLALSIDLWEESLTTEVFELVAGLVEATGATCQDRLSGEAVEFSDASDLLEKTKQSYEQYVAFFSGQG